MQDYILILEVMAVFHSPVNYFSNGIPPACCTSASISQLSRAPALPMPRCSQGARGCCWGWCAVAAFALGGVWVSLHVWGLEQFGFGAGRTGCWRATGGDVFWITV